MKSYDTYYKTSPYDLIECKRIRLFKWIKYPRLTISNMEEVLSIAASDPEIKFWDSKRDNFDITTPFEFRDFTPESPMEFNVVFYLSLYDEALGFTLFSNIQNTSDIESLNIYLKFRYEIEEFEVVLENNLTEHIEQIFTGNLDVEETRNSDLYTTKKMILDQYVDSYPRYSSDVHHYINDSTVSLTNNDKYISHSYYSKLKLNEIEITYPENVNVGMYKRDIVAYEWNRTNYKVTSLVRKNLNGTPYQYFIDRPGYTGDISEIGDVVISKVISEYVICNDSESGREDILFNSRTGKIRSKTPDIQFLSNHYLERSGYLVNNNPKYSELTDKITSSELLGYVRAVLGAETLVGYIVGFEGTFVVVENGEDVTYSNLEGIIKVKKSSDIIVINDNCILEQKNSRFNFYFTDSGSMVSSYDYTINTGSKSVLETKEEYQHLMIQISMNTRSHQLFDGFRKNPITYDIIPNIKCAFGGVLFYVEDNKLKYL